MKQLFAVELTHEIVVLAENAEEAERIATTPSVTIDLGDPDAVATPLRHMPTDWEVNCLPFTDRGVEEKTIDEWVAAGAAPEFRTTKVEGDSR